ncbi:hypothetical protein FB451DRAFT_1369365 [Mycena latifolia]|nr:hypothetical protein FB451DRAFT_1369365 [Mycena latifolia]
MSYLFHSLRLLLAVLSPPAHEPTSASASSSWPVPRTPTHLQHHHVPTNAHRIPRPFRDALSTPSLPAGRLSALVRMYHTPPHVGEGGERVLRRRLNADAPTHPRFTADRLRKRVHSTAAANVPTASVEYHQPGCPSASAPPRTTPSCLQRFPQGGVRRECARMRRPSSAPASESSAYTGAVVQEGRRSARTGWRKRGMHVGGAAASTGACGASGAGCTRTGCARTCRSARRDSTRPPGPAPRVYDTEAAWAHVPGRSRMPRPVLKIHRRLKLSNTPALQISEDPMKAAL